MPTTAARTKVPSSDREAAQRQHGQVPPHWPLSLDLPIPERPEPLPH